MGKKEAGELDGMPERDSVGAAAVEFLACKDRQAEAKEATDRAAERCANAMLDAKRAEVRVGARVVKVKYVEAAATVSVGKAKGGRVRAGGVSDD